MTGADVLEGIADAGVRPRRLPAVEEAPGQLQDLDLFEVAGSRELAVGRSVEFSVEFLDVVERHGLQIGDRFVDGPHVADIPSFLRRHVALERDRCERNRIAPLLFEAGQPLLAEELEFLGRERRLTQHLVHQPENGREVLAVGFDQRR